MHRRRLKTARFPEDFTIMPRDESKAKFAVAMLMNEPDDLREIQYTERTRKYLSEDAIRDVLRASVGALLSFKVRTVPTI